MIGELGIKVKPIVLLCDSMNTIYLLKSHVYQESVGIENKDIGQCCRYFYETNTFREVEVEFDFIRF